MYENSKKKHWHMNTSSVDMMLHYSLSCMCLRRYDLNITLWLAAKNADEFLTSTKQ